MQSQQAIWEAQYAARTKWGVQSPSEFAIEIEASLPRFSHVLELGCGAGHDSAHFARQGHVVTGIDHAPTAIARCREIYPNSGMTLIVQDVAGPLPLTNASCDLIYARLSLHYFTDQVTRRVFAEVGRVLRPDGLLAFMCKSTDDPLYGRGEALESDMFDDGHVRHFFSAAYATDCLKGQFSDVAIQAKAGPLYGEPSAYITVTARRRSEI